MQRVMAKRSRDSKAENVTGISAGKKTGTVADELWEIQCGQLQELKLHGDQVGGASQYCEVYLQEPNQIPTVNTRGKSPWTSGKGRGKEPF